MKEPDKLRVGVTKLLVVEGTHMNGKARMQAWLATQAPGRMLGSAIQEGVVKLNGPKFKSLVTRLRSALLT